jgi:hypothetical protein
LNILAQHDRGLILKLPMTTTRKRLLTAALGTAGLLCAPIIALSTAAAAPVAANTPNVSVASNCWSGVHGVTCVSPNHKTMRACDYARDQKRKQGYRPTICYYAANTINWRPYYFLY